MGLAVQAAHQATLSMCSLSCSVQHSDLGWHQDSDLQSAVWLSRGQGRGWHGVSGSPPWFLESWCSCEQGRQGRGKQAVCSLPGCCGPLGMYAKRPFTTWCRVVCRLAPGPEPCHPQLQRRDPRGLPTAIPPGKEGLYFSWLPKCYCFIGFGNQFYGLRYLSAEIWKAWEGK